MGFRRSGDLVLFGFFFFFYGGGFTDFFCIIIMRTTSHPAVLDIVPYTVQQWEGGLGVQYRI